MGSQIIYNAIKTPEGQIVESAHRHDFRCVTDPISGKEYCVDGGRDYLRRVGAMDFTDISLYDDEPHTTQREVLKWGNRGLDGLQPLTYKSISEMSTDHIEAVLETQTPTLVIRNCMKKELEERHHLVLSAQ